MDSHRINLLELLDLTPEDIEVLRLQVLQLFDSEQSQGQLLQDNVPPPPQPQSHTFQQPFPAGEGPSGVLDPPVYGTLWNPPGNVPPPPQPQVHVGQEPFPAGEDPSGVLDPPVYGTLGNQPDNVAPPPQPLLRTRQEPFLAREDPSGVLGPSEYCMVGNQPDNVAPPPQPQAHIGQEPFPAGEDLSRVLNPSAFSMAGNQIDQPVLPPPPYPSQVEASPVKGANDLKHDPPGFVAPPPVPDQAAGPDPPADTSQQHPCPICGRIFKRTQERNRHLRTFLPQWIYCAFPRSNCPYRCDRRDNLASHWRKKHADSGQVLPSQEQQYQIYNPDPLVALVVGGQMTMEVATEIALSQVEMRAQELGKGDAWARNWWGRRLKPHTDQQ